MTIAVAWLSGDEAIMCADSAITAPRGVRPNPLSSFGEVQDVDGTPVEEGAIKLIEVGDMAVMIAGNVTKALACCEELWSEYETRGVREALLYNHALFKDTEDYFALIIAHRLDGRTVLTVYSSPEGVFFQDDGWRVWTIGPLPDHLKRTIRGVAKGIERMPISAARKLMAMIAAMQALGIKEYLPRHNVGGAMCGLRYDGALHWQDPIVFLMSNPPQLAKSYAAARAASASSNTFQLIRSQVVNGVGFITSSITDTTTVLTSPVEQRSREELIRLATSLPFPGSPFAPVGCYVFVDISKQRAVVTMTWSPSQGALMSVIETDLGFDFEVRRPLLEKINEGLAENRFELAVFSDDSAVSWVSYTVTLHQDEPQDHPDLKTHLS
jgi:hypothetical protein